MSIVHDPSPSDDPRLTKIVSSNSDEISNRDCGELPAKIGRYEVVQRLGSGGQCSVLLGHDPRLSRPVAIKVPRSDRQIDDSVWRDFLHEARSAAKLDHPSILSVIDVDRTDDGIPFVVLEFIDGDDLHSFWKKRTFDLELALQIVRQIVMGLEFIHENGLIHRDLKPTNIMVDRHLSTRITDFGLALDLSASRDSTRKGSIAGTYKFMAPEQLSGERHRIDERTDLWAMGVIIYWMCSGEYPFVGSTFAELQDEIKLQSHRHLYHLNSKVPRELDRICRKCLSSLLHDRYTSAAKMLEDVDALIAIQKNQTNPAGEQFENPASRNGSQLLSQLPKAVPKGLQPFDKNDSAFYLDLLPEPKDRFGVPECLRFWLSRYNTTGHVPHGLIYGAAGCGKTSFLKAGLIPMLPASIEAIYIECTSQSTESDLIQLLNRKLGIEATGRSLCETFRLIREGELLPRDRRILIVFDQFEQYLCHAGDMRSSELVAALRHCDGDRLSCLLAVRDEFWGPTQDFLRHLEVLIQDGRNSYPMPLFDTKHALKILLQFGRTYGAIPNDPNKVTPKQIAFARQAIDSMANNGKVNCAHLAIFAAIVANEPWNYHELTRIGGWQGIVVRFMDEKFSLETAPVSGKRLLPQIRTIVEQLLPASASAMEKVTRTSTQLYDACPTGTEKDKFDAAIRILERECRFINAVAVSHADAASPQKHYQLSHDLLAPPLRDWLEREKKLTWQGRYQIELAEMAEIWSHRKSKQYYPSLPKLCWMRTAVRNRSVSQKQRQFLRQASQFRLRRWSIALLVLALTGATIKFFWSKSVATNQSNQFYAEYLKCDPLRVSEFLEKIEVDGLDVQDASKSVLVSTERERLHDEMAKYLHVKSTPQAATNILKIADKSEIVELPNVIRIFRSNDSKFYVSTALNALFTDASLESRIKYATLAFELGDHSFIEAIIASGSDEIIPLRHRFREFVLPTPALIAQCITDESKDLSLRVFLLSVLFLDDFHNDLSESEKASVLSAVKHIYRSEKSAYAHSMAKWVLLKNEIDVPAAPLVDAAKQWQELEQGITLSKVSIGNELINGLATDVWVSDCEITIDQFILFLNDLDYDGDKLETGPGTNGQKNIRYWQIDKSHSGKTPVVRVSAYIAAMYCNWLSVKNDLTPVYKFFPRHFEVEPNANGFRLPKKEEFYAFSQLDQQGAFSLNHVFQDDWIFDYACFDEANDLESRGSNSNVASRLPNGYGLFDTIGNVSEISVDVDGLKLHVNHLGIANHDPAYCIRDGKPVSTKRYLTLSSGKAGFRVVKNSISKN